MIPLMVALGAALGAPCRYLLDRWVQARHSSGLPLGTLLINLSGSSVLGLLMGLAAGGAISSEVLAAAGTGWCGAFTTYSTFSFETVQLARQKRLGVATGYVLVSIVAGLMLAWGGVELGLALG
ncbi:fluoride efflux transporter CrcB [Kineosporia sp. NBRC 101731]|uniref:fluoride efflux transporter CrcB n=1 Tax=Kineosporia sp. NBRC 101731 TaxID=3032199 RepID=UPI0024A0AA44|nr:fluoride efflux transporter CrcB [Kineosporia sp. NBRC 101731]GLY30168.1 putative fluoride ion transporter CrcB 2 [Kineosporia sp. NBRC 101731]